jgi:DNA-directed RNA polymerase I subunit RPA2
MRYWLHSPVVSPPTREGAAPGADARLFPRDCREAGTTYRAPLSATLSWGPAAPPDAVTGEPGPLTGPVTSVSVKLGGLPIMVKSRACTLRGAGQARLVAAREERVEFGGHFVANGIDRVLRAIIQQRRHTVLALRRGAYAKRGPGFTELAAVVRCVRPDESSATVRCHYLAGGGAAFALTIGRAEFFVPAGLVLRALGDATDRELYDAIVGPSPRGDGGDGSGDGSGAGAGNGAASTTSTPPPPAAVADAAEAIVRQAAARGVRTRAACLAHLGGAFRAALAEAAGADPAAGWDPLARLSDAAVGARLVRDRLFVHLSNPDDKLAYGLALVRRLLAAASGVAGEDDADAATAHEILLPGAVLACLSRDRLGEGLAALAATISRDVARGRDGTADPVDPADPAYVARSAAARLPDLGARIEYLLNTGNLVTRPGGGGDLPQASGFSIVAERLNWSRYVSHFRSVHRGAYFAQLRTTAVRKLRPEGWGFLCPVHTPDGAPCGLLNHLAAACRVVAGHGAGGGSAASAAAATILAGAGVLPLPGGTGAAACPPSPSYLEVVIDGRFHGTVPASRAGAAVAALRAAKSAALAAEAGGGGGSDAGQVRGGESVFWGEREKNNAATNSGRSSQKTGSVCGARGAHGLDCVCPAPRPGRPNTPVAPPRRTAG